MENTKLDNPSTAVQFLDWCYDRAVDGFTAFPSIDDMVVSYINPNKTVEEQIDSLIGWQCTKSATSGFLTGLPGLIAMPVTVPANITSVILVQIRMSAAIAKMRGYDIHDDQVKSFVYATLAGKGASDILKNAGIVIGKKAFAQLVDKTLTRSVTKAINQAVGFRLITKAGSTGVINGMKLVPLIGGIIGGVFDWNTTKAVGKAAKNVFEPI